MHGLTGGSWKRSLRPPRQLPTLLKKPVAAIARAMWEREARPDPVPETPVRDRVGGTGQTSLDL
jgi:hypothetical protein